MKVWKLLIQQPEIVLEIDAGACLIERRVRQRHVGRRIPERCADLDVVVLADGRTADASWPVLRVRGRRDEQQQKDSSAE